MPGVRWRHPVIRQWALLLAASIGAVVLACVYGVFWRADLAVYDGALPTGPAPADIVIVAVDDASVAQLGRWPWRRAVHAALLDRLRALGVKAVALDIVLTEPDPVSAAGDVALAEAMARGPPTVLPLLAEMPAGGEPLRERLPIPALASAAAGIGHAHLELDRDGIARSVFLREGLGTPNRPHFAVALLQSVVGAAPLRLTGARHPDLAGAPKVWVRDYQMLIPFLGPPGHFTTVSYVDVLRGSVSEPTLRGKLVLVGATAQGIGDAYPTPRSGHGRAMSGVEVTANVLEGLRSGTLIRRAPLPATLALALAPILVVFLGFLRLTARQSLVLVVALWLGTLTVSVLALRLAGWWVPPAATLAALSVIYPLWSWRRLEATQSFLDDEFTRFTSERLPLLGALPAPPAAANAVDLVERRIELLRHATQRLRNVRRLLAATIRDLPDGTILADPDGRILLANAAAATLFGCTDAAALEGGTVDAYLHARVPADHLRFAALAAAAPCTVEATLPEAARDVLVRAVPFLDGSAARLGTIVALADITELRAAQRERDDVLRFLSHDMKSPASSLLGLAALQREPDRALPASELSQRLDVLAHRTLALVDGFVALARAESADPRAFAEFDLRDAMQDACDELWAAAEARGVRIDARLPDGTAIVHGDRHLLARAIVNLLSNAVKFSPVGASVRLACECSARAATVRVVDRGPGIAPAQQAALFRRFARGVHPGAGDPGGTGLGLAFVRVVAEKHGGRAWLENDGPPGATFCLAVPLAPPPASGP